MVDKVIYEQVHQWMEAHKENRGRLRWIVEAARSL